MLGRAAGRTRRWRRPSRITTPTELPLVVGERQDRACRGRLGLGAKSPVVVHETLFADVMWKPARSVPLDADHEERASIWSPARSTLPATVSGPGCWFSPGDRCRPRAGRPFRRSAAALRMDGPRHIWWNFVSSSKDRIEQAKADWKAGRFENVPGDEIEFIPLPRKLERHSPRRAPNSRSALPCRDALAPARPAIARASRDTPS